MKSVSYKLTFFALSSISISLLLKRFGIAQWEISAYIGGGFLFLAITVIFGEIFHLKLLTSLFISSLFTTFVMYFTSSFFAMIMVIISVILLFITLLYIKFGHEI